MLDSDVFTVENGANSRFDLTMLALSTCGFCKRAIQFLRDGGYSFKYVYVDQIDPEIRRSLKDEVAKTFRVRIIFPTLIIDSNRVISGYAREKYQAALSEAGASGGDKGEV